MNQRETLGFNAKITPVRPLNDEMTLCKCYVLALGKNRNYSHISKDAVEAALPTIYNIPVVGHVYVGEDGEYHMGGHDMTIARNEEGKLEFRSLCVPFGVVPEQDNIHYETIIDSYGNEVIYQVADIILWTGRYPDLYKAIYDDDIYFGQSMEINVKAYEPLDDDASYTNIKKFTYSALCLLGKSDDPEYHVEPCFPDSRVEPYHFSVDDSKFNEMMTEFKKELSECFQTINTNKGGKERLTIEVLNSVLAEFGLAKEDLNFEVTEEMTEEELRENLAKAKPQNKEKPVEEEPVIEPEEETKADEVQEDIVDEVPAEEPNEVSQPNVDEEPVEEVETPVENQDQTPSETEKKSPITFASTYLDKILAITTACDGLQKCEDEMCIMYSFTDCDDKYAYLKEYAYDHGTESQRFVRVEYAMNDDKVEFVGEFVTVKNVFLTLEEVEDLERKRAEYDELKKFHDERIESDRIKEYDAIVSEFPDLANNEEFSKLVEDKLSFESAEALREKCFAIRGKTMAVKSAEKPATRIPIDFSKKNSAEPVYGGFFSKYPPRSGK